MIGIAERQGSGRLYYYTGGHIMRDDIPNHEPKLIGKFKDYTELRNLMKDWYEFNSVEVGYERYMERNEWVIDVDFGSWTTFLKVEYDK